MEQINTGHYHSGNKQHSDLRPDLSAPKPSKTAEVLLTLLQDITATDDEAPSGMILSYEPGVTLGWETGVTVRRRNEKQCAPPYTIAPHIRFTYQSKSRRG